MADHDTHDHTGVPGVGGDMSNPMTTSGDIIYGGASGTPTRLAKGTDDQVLTLVAGAPAWADATGGGGGGGGTTPTYDQTLAYVNATNTISVSIPASAVAGDLMIAFVASDNDSNIPSGWAALVRVTGQSWTNHSLFVRVATSADITAGSYTFTFGGSGSGEVILVSVHGYSRITGYADGRTGSSVTSLTMPQPTPYSFGMGANDLALYMVGVRSASSTISWDQGTLVARRAADAAESSALYAATHTGGPIIATASWTPNGGQAGMAIVTVAG